MSIIFSNTKIYYSDNSNLILDIKSLEFKKDINFIIGKNGSGKSTLLKSLSNFSNEINYKGEILIDDKPLSNINIGLVTQNPLQSINTELSFLENLLLSDTIGYNHISLKKQITKKSKSKIISFLQSFENWDFLSNLIDKQASNLSSGQQQMLAILMRVIRYQKVLLLDECTANLDTENTNIIIGIILEIIKKGTIVIFATHQSELLKTEHSNIYIVENGTIRKE